MVGETGTFVNKDSTSSDAKMPLGVVLLSKARNPSVELIWYWAGRWGVIIVFNTLAVSQMGVGIWEIMRRSGLLGLCILTVPYKYPGLYLPVMVFIICFLLSLLIFFIIVNFDFQFINWVACYALEFSWVE